MSNILRNDTKFCDDDEKAGVVKQKGIRGFFTNEYRTTISIHASISLLPSSLSIKWYLKDNWV